MKHYSSFNIRHNDYLYQEVVHLLRHLGGAVEPADADHQVVALALFELGYVADVEGLVGSLGLDEDRVPGFVLSFEVVTSVTFVLAVHGFPGFAVGNLFGLSIARLPNLLLLYIGRDGTVALCL